ncbi:SGNH/GDSL hydrolase family protein [Klebsiella pneumoniae]|uniref:SGNH/GDSL hydrolase family protein n=1 Tax=Klebsiella pneumoniae TaxID=573 RepID=UPI001F4B6730|nr:SGNH/GDSL hydrolase family protein [Klebsiella pneumoniae]
MEKIVPQSDTAFISGVVTEYSTLSLAQQDIANIPDGYTCWVKNTADSVLSDEYVNNAGTLVPTGRKTPEYSFLRRGNILFDAFNEYTATSLRLGGWDWYRGASVTFSSVDTDLPLPTPVIQASGVYSFDKYYDLKRLPLRPGDDLTCSVLAWFQQPGGRFQISWLNSAGEILSTITKTGLTTGIVSPALKTQMPVGAVSLRFRVENTISGSFKIGAYAAAVGLVQPEFIRGVPDKEQVKQQVEMTTISLSSRIDNLKVSVSDAVTEGITVQSGYYINRTTGVVAANPALDCAFIDHVDGDVWKVSARVFGTAVSLAVYYNASGEVVGREYDGTNDIVNLTDYLLSVPPGTAKIGITTRTAVPISVKKMQPIASSDLLASVRSLESKLSKIEESLPHDFKKQNVVIQTSYYINRTTGAVSPSSAFECAIFDYDDGDRWKVTARVNGASVSLAVYYGANGTVIGTEGDGTTESVDYTDYELTPPSGTASIGITTRIAVPIIAKKYVVVPGGSTAKPDSSSTQISMCDDVRINALDTSAAAWICGPWGTNDWAQNIPIGTITDTVNTTVYGALNIIAQKLRARAPTKPILWATPFNGDYDSPRSAAWVDGETNGYGRVSDYAAAIRAVALRYGFPLIDLNADCGWTKFNSSNFLMTEGDTNPSRIHLNADTGPARISSLVIDRLTSLETLVS